MAVCIAVLDRANFPLHLLTNDPTKEVAFHYILHTSLDVIEERTTQSTSSGPSTSGKPAEPLRDLYLGVLYSTEQHKVFGYVTNTNVKFVIIVDASNTNIRDNEIRQMFRKLHNGYSNLLYNPFYMPGTRIESKKFNVVVQSLLLPHHQTK
jgi:hypothetical protein